MIGYNLTNESLWMQNIHLDHAHLCSQNWHRPFKLIRFSIHRIFSVHRFFVCGCIAKTFKILLETCTVWVGIICFSLFGATPLWIVPIASDTWSTHIFCIYWNHRLRAVSLHKTMIVSILAVHTQNRRLNTVCKMRKNIREETRCVRFTYGTWFLLLVLLNIFNINIREDAAETAYQFCSWFCLLILFLFTRKIRFKQKN